MNSGILAKGIGDNITYFYDKIPESIKIKYNEISRICDQYNISVPAVALQFCYANKQVASLVIGMDREDQVDNNISNLNIKIPNDFWHELINAKIIDERCALPKS